MKIQQSLGYLLNTSARLIKRRLDRQLEAYGITTAQWALLKLLAVEGELSQAEIAEKGNSDRATCGTIIDKLIAKGYVKKMLSESDRRSYRVSLLPQAAAIVEEVTRLAQSVNAEAVKGLTGEEIAALARCLNVIISNIGGEEHDADA